MQTELQKIKELRKLNGWSYSNQIRDDTLNAIGNDESDNYAEQEISAQAPQLLPLWRKQRHRYPYHLSGDMRGQLFLEEMAAEPEIAQAQLDELTDRKVQNLVDAYQADDQNKYLAALDKLEDVPF